MSDSLITRGIMPPGAEKTEQAERMAISDAYRKSVCDELMSVFDPTPYIEWLQPITDRAKAREEQSAKETQRRIKEDEIHRFGGEQR